MSFKPSLIFPEFREKKRKREIGKDKERKIVFRTCFSNVSIPITTFCIVFLVPKMVPTSSAAGAK